LRRSLDQQVDPFGAIEAIYGEDEVLIRVAVKVERRRRRREHLCIEPRGFAEPSGNDRRRREDLARLAECNAIELEHLAAECAVLSRFRELSELGAVEIPRLAELMEKPDDL